MVLRLRFYLGNISELLTEPQAHFENRLFGGFKRKWDGAAETKEYHCY